MFPRLQIYSHMSHLLSSLSISLYFIILIFLFLSSPSLFFSPLPFFSSSPSHSITVAEVMRWNGITDVRQCYAGMSLIVRKADTDKPTDAEKLLLQKEKRLEGGAKLAEKISKESALTDAMMEEGAKLAKYNRVHKIATDIDYFSLGNRLFGTEKRQLELFPDKINPNENTRSLAGRFRAEDERKKEELRQADKGISDFSVSADQEVETEEDAQALAWALKTGSKVRPRYFISADNEDEWGRVADDLAVVMLQMLVEYEVRTQPTHIIFVHKIIIFPLTF